ncbi:MAG: competence protein ComEC family protein [Bacteroidales bacterium]|nr:competence protein ComEC family protein [Bacteroidales bacterium]
MFPIARTILRFVWEDFRRLPILRCLVPFAVGIVASRNVETSLFYIAAGTIVSAALLLLYVWYAKRVKEKKWAAVSNIAIVLALFAFGMAYSQMRRSDIVGESGSAQIYGYVREIVRDTEDEQKLCIHADSLVIGGQKYVNVDGLIKLENDRERIVTGREISGEVKLWPSRQRRYASFDNETWMRGKNYSFVGTSDSLKCSGKTKWTMSTMIYKIREKVSMRLMASGVSEKNMGIVMALLMGDRSRLDKGVRMAFTDCGIVHILAVSGLHVALVYGLIVMALGGLREKRPWLYWGIGLVVLWVYAIICGMSPSVTRAAIMMSVIETGRVLGKTRDPMNTLYVAVFVILMINPMDIYSIGLYLSFMAVWGILNLYIPIRNKVGKYKWKWLGYVIDSVMLSFSAQVATMPVSLLYFHRFPIYFLIHNVLLVWMVGPMISIAIVAIVCGGSIPVGEIVDMILTKFCEYAEWASSWPNSVVENVPCGIAESVSMILLLYVIGWLIGERWAYWKVARLRLTVVFCVFMVVASFLVSGVYYNMKRATVVYDIYGCPTVHVVDRGRSVHVLLDTLDKAELKFSEEIDSYYHIYKSEMHLMRDGMEIETPCGRLVIVDSKEKMKESGDEIVLVTGEVGPCENKAEKILLSGRAIRKKDWMESESAWKCESTDEEPWIVENGWIGKMKENIE